jgi:hypothetical protein
MNPLDAYTSGIEIGNIEIGAGARATGPAGGQRVQMSGGQLQRILAGVPRQSVAAAASADLSIVVSEAFRPERIVLSTAAQALDVTNVRIGTKSLNVTSNPISGNVFSEQAIGTHVIGYTAQPGVGFVVSVTNNTVAAITTGGGVLGLALN